MHSTPTGPSGVVMTKPTAAPFSSTPGSMATSSTAPARRVNGKRPRPGLMRLHSLSRGAIFVDRSPIPKEAPMKRSALLAVCLASIFLALAPLAGCGGGDDTPGSHTEQLGNARHAPGFRNPLVECTGCHGSAL